MWTVPLTEIKKRLFHLHETLFRFTFTILPEYRAIFEVKPFILVFYRIYTATAGYLTVLAFPKLSRSGEASRICSVIRLEEDLFTAARY